MRITFDRSANAAYIHLIAPEPGVAVKTEVVSAPHIKGIFHLDFNKNGRLIGIEVLGATQVLPSDVLEQAERL